MEAAAVFQDVFFGVPFGETKTENFFAVLIGNAARLSTEAVDEPREFGEFGDLEDLNASHVTLDPGSFEAGAGV